MSESPETKPYRFKDWSHLLWEACSHDMLYGDEEASLLVYHAIMKANLGDGLIWC